MGSYVTERAIAALQNAFIGDALAMPVHWFYNPSDIYRIFPLGVEQFEDAPAFHPSSIMSLHSTRQGGRANKERNVEKEIVGRCRIYDEIVLPLRVAIPLVNSHWELCCTEW